jgi:NAD(P)-dependent dehydrogenase (short-subunit alcohol dehydrogenase family)
VAIVTGGSRGVGRDLARALGCRGDAVVVVYLSDQAEAEAVVEEILAAQGAAVTVRADVADELDVKRLFDEAAAAFGPVHVVVHAAGRGGSVLYPQAARRLSRGGAIVSVFAGQAVPPDLVRELASRGITVHGLAPGLEPPGRDHDVASLLWLLDRWRRGSSS